jgi:hypothetical protein
LVGTKEIIGTKHSDEIMSWAKELGIEKYTMLMKFLVWTFRGLCCKSRIRITVCTKFVGIELE